MSESRFDNCSAFIEVQKIKSETDYFQLQYLKAYTAFRLLKLNVAEKILIEEILSVDLQPYQESVYIKAYCLLAEIALLKKDEKKAISYIFKIKNKKLLERIETHNDVVAHYKLLEFKTSNKAGKEQFFKDEYKTFFALFDNVKFDDFYSIHHKVDAYWQFANFWNEQRDSLKANELYLEALSIVKAKKHEEKLYQGLYKYAIGNTEFRKGQYEAANHYYLESIKLYQDLPTVDYVKLGAAFRSSAIVNTYLGEYSLAIKQQLKAIDNVLNVFEENDPKLIRYYYSLGNAYAFANKPREGLQYFHKARELELLTRDERSTNMMFIYYGIASAYYKEKNFSEALEWAKKAKFLLFKQRAPIDNKHTINNIIGACYIELGRLSKALAIHKENLQLVKDLDNQKIFKINSLGNIAEVHYKLGEFDIALQYSQQALKILDPLYEKNNVFSMPSIRKGVLALNEVVLLLTNKAKILRAIYQQDNKLDEYLQMAEKIIERIYDLLNDKYSASFFDVDIQLLNQHTENYFHQTVINIYTDLYKLNNFDQYYLYKISACIDANKAFQLTEALKRSTYRKIPKEIRDSLREMKKEIDQLEDVLVKTDSFQFITNQINDIWQVYDTTLSSFKKEFLEKGNLENIYSEERIIDFQQNISSDMSVLTYLCGDSTLYAISMNRDSLYFWTVAMTESVLITNVQYTFEKALLYYVELAKTKALSKKEQTAFIEIGKYLYSKLIPKKHILESSKRITVIRDGVLAYLPFEILITDDLKISSLNNVEYLLSKVAIHYEPSIGVSSNRLQQTIIEEVTPLLIAPDFSMNGAMKSHNQDKSKLVDLPEAINEIKAIHEIIGGMILHRDVATKQRFIELYPGSKIIHFATHAEADTLNYLNSQLFFSISDSLNPDEYGLNSMEIQNLNMNTDLVCLHACNTGNGKNEVGEGVMSLGRSFLNAGARSVLVSLSSIVDEESPKLLEKFYWYLKKGYPKDIALQRAKVDFIDNANDNNKYPYFWANIILIGDPGSIFPKQKKYNNIWMVILGGLFLVLFFFAIRKRLVR